jgi:hypothetical protein
MALVARQGVCFDRSSQHHRLGYVTSGYMHHCGSILCTVCRQMNEGRKINVALRQSRFQLRRNTHRFLLHFLFLRRLGYF